MGRGQVIDGRRGKNPAIGFNPSQPFEVGKYDEHGGKQEERITLHIMHLNRSNMRISHYSPRTTLRSLTSISSLQFLISSKVFVRTASISLTLLTVFFAAEGGMEVQVGIVSHR